MTESLIRALAHYRQQGRADAAAAIRLAAESVVPGAEMEWLRPGHLRASDVRKWLIEWAANIAENGPTSRDTYTGGTE